MKPRVLTILAVLLLLSTQALDLAAAQSPVSELVILGPTYTNTDLLQRYIPINVGEPTNTAQLLLAQERIDALNVTASTNISRVDSRVLVRITDGQGFVVEPLEFTVSSLINLMLGNLKLVYHNLFGYAINPYINYNLSTDEAYYGIQTPGWLLPVYHDLGYHVHEDTYPTDHQDLWIDKKEGYWQVSYIPAPGWRPSGKLVYSHRESPGSTSPHSDSTWWLYEMNIPYRYSSSEVDYRLGYTHLVGFSSHQTSFEKREGNISLLLKNKPYNLHLQARLGTSSADTPPDQRYYLGGEEIQPGYPEKSFWGLSLASYKFEVGYELIPESLQLKFLAEFSQIGDSLSNLSRSNVKKSLGFGLNLPNPSSLLEIFVATPSNQWNPRFSMRFRLY